MNVKTFLLSDGTELIAELVSTQPDHYVIKRPLRVAPMRGPDGQMHLGFAIWGMTIDTSSKISLKATAVFAEPQDPIGEIATSYIEQVSGIAMPTPSSSQIITG